MSQANVPEVGMTNAPGNSSWTPGSLAVLERACDYFGGCETWRVLRAIRLFGERLSGFVPWLKGNGHTFVAPRTFEIRPARWNGHDYHAD